MPTKYTNTLKNITVGLKWKTSHDKHVQTKLNDLFFFFKKFLVDCVETHLNVSYSCGQNQYKGKINSNPSRHFVWNRIFFCLKVRYIFSKNSGHFECLELLIDSSAHQKSPNLKKKCLPKRQRNELKNSVFVNTSPLLSTSIPVQLRTAIYMFACYSMLLKSIYLFILFDYVSTLSKAHNSISIWALIWPTPDLIFLNVEELYWSQNLKWWKFYNVKHIMYGYSNLS